MDDRQDEQDEDNRHQFQSGKAAADRDRIEDREGHQFTRGRVEERDETDRS